MTPAGVETVNVSINGQSRRVPANASVAELLVHLGIVPDRVAIEVNKSIVRRRDWENTLICANADVEVVEFVGGG